MSSDQPRLLAPVTGDSRVVHRVGVRYSEVDAVPVLWEPSSRALHELSPAAAALWGALDGRLLREVADGLAVDPGLAPTLLGEVIEAVRRLRVLGVVEDSDGSEPAPTSLQLGVPASAVVLGGELVDEGEGARLLLSAPAAGEGPSPAGSRVLLDVGSLAVVPEPAIGAAPRPLVGITVDDTSEPDDPRMLTPVELLGHLMAAVPADVAPNLLVLDALAGVAERVPGSVGVATGP